MTAAADSFKFRWLELMNESRELTHTQHRVAVYCFSRSNPDGSNVRPSQQTVAEALGMHVNSVANAMKKLTASGWLVLTQKGVAGQGYNRTNVYQLRLPEDVVLPTAQSVGIPNRIDTAQIVGNRDGIPTAQSVGIPDPWEPNTHNSEANTHNFGPNTHIAEVWTNSPLTNPSQVEPKSAERDFSAERPGERRTYPNQPPLMQSVEEPKRAPSDPLSRILSRVPNPTEQEVADVRYWLSNGDSEQTVIAQLQADRARSDYSRPKKLLTEEAS